MAKVLVLVEDDNSDLGDRLATVLGNSHTYTFIAVAPDRHTPFLDDDTVAAAQAEVEEEYRQLADAAAEPLGAACEVRAGNPAAQFVAAAEDEHAELVVVEAPRHGLWSQLTKRSPAGYVLAHAPCPVLLLPPRRRGK